jgi:hypothetical protein
MTVETNKEAERRRIWDDMIEMAFPDNPNLYKH